MFGPIAPPPSRPWQVEQRCSKVCFPCSTSAGKGFAVGRSCAAAGNRHAAHAASAIVRKTNGPTRNPPSAVMLTPTRIAVKKSRRSVTPRPGVANTILSRELLHCRVGESLEIRENFRRFGRIDHALREEDADHMAVKIRRREIYGTPGLFGWDGGFGTSSYPDPAERMNSKHAAPTAAVPGGALRRGSDDRSAPGHTQENGY